MSVPYISPVSKEKYSLFDIYRLHKIINQKNIDVLHCHLPKAYLIGYLLKKLNPNLILIAHQHDYPNIRHQGPLNKWIYNSFFSKTYHTFDLILAPSNALAYALNNLNIPLTKIQVIYNFTCIERNWHLPKSNLIQEKERLHLSSYSFIFGFAGRIVHAKGWDILVNVAQKFTSTYTGVGVVFAGNGTEKNSLISSIAYHSHIHFIGHYEQIFLFYNLIDCLVMPSRKEAMGLSHLEAQALGTPVIVSSVPGLQETIHDEENALVFKTENENHLFTQMEKLYFSNSLQNHLSKKGIENSKNYDAQTYVEHLEDIYRDLLKR
jgi:glycosyltransferase involved in cell wall biosynthesis